MMKRQIFRSLSGRVLYVKYSKTKVVLEVDLNEGEEPRFKFEFSEGDFSAFASFMELISREIWATFMPKEASSQASDYDEYYDKDFDNNGYLSIGENCIYIEGPHTTTGRLYQFNKAKMQSFIFDLRKRII